MKIIMYNNKQKVEDTMNKIKRKLISAIIIILTLLVTAPALFADNPKPSNPNKTTCRQCNIQRSRFRIWSSETDFYSRIRRQHRSLLRKQKTHRLRRHRINRLRWRYSCKEAQRERYMRRNHERLLGPINP